MDPRHGCKVTDDFGIIEDSRTDIKVKSITVYASHYIMAIEVVYIESDLSETVSVHAANSKYKNERPDIDKCTLNLAEDEYIDYINYSYSSQKKFIRSIQVGTTGGHLMIMEGQIELNNMNADSQDSTYSSLVNNIGLEKDVSRKSASPLPQNFQNNSVMRSPNNEAKLSFSEPYNKAKHDEKFNAKPIREVSFVGQKKKNRTLDLIKLKHRVVGLKTRFSDYLEEIELYTEPCTYHDPV